MDRFRGSIQILQVQGERMNEDATIVKILRFLQKHPSDVDTLCKVMSLDYNTAGKYCKILEDLGLVKSEISVYHVMLVSKVCKINYPRKQIKKVYMAIE